MIKNAIIFMLGAAVGIGGSYLYFTKKYKDYVTPEEVESVKKEFHKARKEFENKPDLEKLADTIKKEGYLPQDERPVNNSIKAELRPRIISEEEYYKSDYTAVSLIYWGDRIVTFADNYELVDDVDTLIGFESLLGFNDDGSSYVANDKIKTVFEISTDERNYKDVVKRKRGNDLNDSEDGF